MLYTFILPNILMWFRKKVHERRTLTEPSSTPPFLTQPSSTLPSECELVAAVHHPSSQLTANTTGYPRSNVASELPTDISLLSEVDVGKDSDEASHNALLSVVYMYMRFDALKRKVLDKFMALNLSDFQQFLVSLTINCGPEKQIPFFDTAVVFLCETLTIIWLSGLLLGLHQL